MRRSIVLLVVSLFIGSLSLAGQGKGNGNAGGEGNGNAGDKGNVNQNAKADNRGFGAAEQRIIREWFLNGANLKGLPPGLAKRDELPPGLQQQLARNGKLPPGLEKKIQPLPAQLETQLPRLTDGRRRIVLGGNVILLEPRTGAILDILKNIF